MVLARVSATIEWTWEGPFKSGIFVNMKTRPPSENYEAAILLYEWWQ